MEIYKATASLFLDKRKAKNNGTYPIKLTIYRNPDKKRYSTNLYINEADWDKIHSPRLKDEHLKTLKIRAYGHVEKAEKLISDIEDFSFEQFEELFFESSKPKISLKIDAWFNRYIDELGRQGRVGTQSSYKTTLNSFIAYKGNVTLTQIDKKYLMGFEELLTEEGKSPSTIGIYMRQMRAIINQAIEEGVLKSECYPFKSYQIPTSRNIKKALNDEGLKLLLEYKPKEKELVIALDFWLLSYLCNGMNMVDLLHLKPENINGSYLSFVREKTKRTKKKNLTPTKVALNERAVQIINRLKTREKGRVYLFPVLENCENPRAIKNKTQAFIKKVNAGMEVIRLRLKIDQKLNTYSARHSYCSRLMRMGVSAEFLREALDHSSVLVTQNYMGDFKDKVKTEYANLLVNI